MIGDADFRPMLADMSSRAPSFYVAVFRQTRRLYTAIFVTLL
jgi:hypothetical protein